MRSVVLWCSRDGCSGDWCAWDGSCGGNGGRGREFLLGLLRHLLGLLFFLLAAALAEVVDEGEGEETTLPGVTSGDVVVRSSERAEVETVY